MLKSFAKGLHLQYNKTTTEKEQIAEAILPARVVIPLLQHLGAPCKSLVAVGDQVIALQKIGESSGFISAPVHASISGQVTAINQMFHPCGGKVEVVVIEGQVVQRSTSNVDLGPWTLDNISSEEIRKIVKEAGIVGLGGAAFPTHVKLTPPKDKKIETILINGCECEPYITADHRLMLEQAADILSGAKLIAKACSASQIIFGVESNKKDAIKVLRDEIRRQPEQGIYDGIEVVELASKYPQGSEKMLATAILGKEVPSGGLPLDIGVVVSNVGTAIAVFEAVAKGLPLTKRVVTVTGSAIKKPQNLLVRLGTSVAEVVEQCGGLSEDTAKVILGGPMMGVAIASLDIPVVKATSCVLAMTKEEAKVYEEKACIRCGRCIKACPVGLLPNFMADYAKLKNWDMAAEYNVSDCIECGSCAYGCPSRIPLVQYFKLAKLELQLRKRLCQ